MSPRVRVRPARAEGAGPLAALHRDNREHLAPFEPDRDEEFFTEPGQRRRLAVSFVRRSAQPASDLTAPSTAATASTTASG